MKPTLTGDIDRRRAPPGRSLKHLFSHCDGDESLNYMQGKINTLLLKNRTISVDLWS